MMAGLSAPGLGASTGKVSLLPSRGSMLTFQHQQGSSWGSKTQSAEPAGQPANAGPRLPAEDVRGRSQRRRVAERGREWRRDRPGAQS